MDSTESFAGLVLRCWSGKFSVISPVNFKASLGNHKSEFKNNRQVRVSIFERQVSAMK